MSETNWDKYGLGVEQNFDCGLDWTTDDWHIIGKDYKSEKEAENRYDEVISALKLQELIKNRIENEGDNDYDLSTTYILQELLEESSHTLTQKVS